MLPDKKAVFFSYKRTVFLSGTPNFFGPSCFEAALALGRDVHTIQMKLILLCVWAELAILGSAKTALKFKYEI